MYTMGRSYLYHILNYIYHIMKKIHIKLLAMIISEWGDGRSGKWTWYFQVLLL